MEKIRKLFLVLLNLIIGFVIGYAIKDGDLLSHRVGKELKLERDITILNNTGNRFVLPSGTFLYHFSSSKWDDVLIIKIITEEGIIGEITSPVPTESKNFIYYQESPTLEEIIEEYEKGTK
jgi:hypothetical protein